MQRYHFFEVKLMGKLRAGPFSSYWEFQRSGERLYFNRLFCSPVSRDYGDHAVLLESEGVEKVPRDLDWSPSGKRKDG